MSTFILLAKEIAIILGIGLPAIKYLGHKHNKNISDAKH